MGVSLYIQTLGAALFGLAFLFLWSYSRITYFALWSAAWAVEALAIVFAGWFFAGGGPATFALYCFGEYGFAVFMMAAARVGPRASSADWRPALKLFAAFPLFFAVAWALRSRAGENYHALHAFVIGAVYLYSFRTIRGTSGTGGRMFRYSLLFLSLAFFQHAMVAMFNIQPQATPRWVLMLQSREMYDLVLHTLLVFAAMAMWIESEADRIRELSNEIDRVRKESAANMDLDRLTGLLNQSALARRMEQNARFAGVVAVCDMDNFKQVNDRYGHLVGDEILRGVGHLMRSSIRTQDEAYRWGGDEFVIVFQNQNLEIVNSRMQSMQARLKEFNVRGYGVIPISFSWGTAEADGRSLREMLDEADQGMYGSKRTRAAQS